MKTNESHNSPKDIDYLIKYSKMMKKNCIIAVLAVLVIVLFASVKSMSSRASYWMNRCDAAEAVISQVEEQQEDYVLDVLCEGDAWSEWMEYNPE